MKTFLSRIAWIVIVFGAVLGYMGVSDCYYNSKTPVDYATVKESDITKGIIVEGDLFSNLGAFQESYTTTNGVKTGNSKYSYMIPIGDKQYMGLENNTSDMQSALERQADMTYNYLSGNSTTQPDAVHFKGRVRKMSNETKGYMKSYMTDFGFTQSEVDEYLLDYYIQCETYDGWGTELAIALVLLLIGGAILLLPILIARKKYAAPNNSFSGIGTVVSDSLDDANVSAFQTSSVDAADESQTETFDDETFEQSNTENFNNTQNNSFGSGLGEGMLDDYQSFHNR